MRTCEPATGKAPEIRAEKTDSDEIPSRERRLLALARYWSAIRYFYGYHDFIPDWDDVLEASIPDFEAARTRDDYLFALGHLASATHDGHSYIAELWSGMGAQPDISVRTAEGQLVVQDVGPGEHTVQRGDIVLTINGEPAKDRISRLMNLLPHSTERPGNYWTDYLALAGPEPDVRLTIQKQDGSKATVSLNRTGPLSVAPRPKYRVLPEGFGYIDIGHIPAEDLDVAMAAVAGSKGLILDLRGYPPDTSIASRLAARRVSAVRNVFRIWHGPEPALSEIRVETEIITPRQTPQYTGPVVVLIDPDAGSRPKWTCMELEAAVHPTFIGGRTAGMIGTVINMVLSGGVVMNFSASQQRHADGTPLQRVGIIPDITVEPTIEGVRQGRDEILERAVLFLKLEH